jgi:hypothetical protein
MAAVDGQRERLFGEVCGHWEGCSDFVNVEPRVDGGGEGGAEGACGA